MKKKDILISLAIIATCAGVLYLYSFTDSLVHGSVDIDSGDAHAAFWLRSSLFGRKELILGSRVVQFNTRILKPKYLEIRKDEDGKKLVLDSYGPWGSLSKIKIINNEKITLKLGPPLKIIPDVVQHPGHVTIGFTIMGRANEHYQIPVLNPTPKVKIMNEHGEILASGSFSYG